MFTLFPNLKSSDVLSSPARPKPQIFVSNSILEFIFRAKLKGRKGFKPNMKVEGAFYILCQQLPHKGHAGGAE